MLNVQRLNTTFLIQDNDNSACYISMPQRMSLPSSRLPLKPSAKGQKNLQTNSQKLTTLPVST